MKRWTVGFALLVVMVAPGQSKAAIYTFKKIAEVGGTLYGFAGEPAINNSGTVAFYAVPQDPSIGSTAIFAGSGGPLTTIVATAPSGLGFTRLYDRVSINDSGTVAFAGELFVGRTRTGIFTGGGGATTTIALDRPLSSDLSINNSGTVAFKDFEKIVAGSGGPLTTIEVAPFV